MWRQAGAGLQTGEGEGSLEGRCISASLPGQNRLSWEHYLPPTPTPWLGAHGAQGLSQPPHPGLGGA